jgi:hypothetical protein
MSSLNEDTLCAIFDQFQIFARDRDRLQSVYFAVLPPKSPFHYLDKDMLKNLSAASLVCKKWRPLAQDRLFSILFLDDENKLEKARALLDRAGTRSGAFPARALMVKMDSQTESDGVLAEAVRACKKLTSLAILYENSPPKSSFLTLPEGTRLTTFYFACGNFNAERWFGPVWNPTRASTEPAFALKFSDFQEVLISMPLLRKLFILFPVDSGFSTKGICALSSLLTPNPPFRLRHLEVHTYEFPLSLEQYKWLLGSSHTTLHTAIIGLEGAEALVDCCSSLRRLRIVDTGRWLHGHFVVLDPEQTALESLMRHCDRLAELTAHIEVIERFLRSPTLPPSLKRIMLGQLDYEFSEEYWQERYPRLYQELVTAPHARLPNLKTVVVEILSDYQLGDDGSNETGFLHTLFDALGDAGIQIWREVFEYDVDRPPVCDTVYLDPTRCHGFDYDSP